MSPKQKKVIAYLRENETLSIEAAVELIGQDVYTNRRFHVGNLLSNMVKKQMIQRARRGVFTLRIEREQEQLELI